jgi:hypothetical protein
MSSTGSPTSVTSRIESSCTVVFYRYYGILLCDELLCSVVFPDGNTRWHRIDFFSASALLNIEPGGVQCYC